ncbi:hypothetical protein [Nocardia otitidiscaviarum]|uniref:hypothetical protein n=1 Tax=Nocardia otitidiscaviarum TaxID=1823 RepID=UPI0004A776C7|nr:hypothetical protein [Nocardia otitidiscaviarum]
MPDVTFPAHITLTSETDVDGLPVLTAAVTLAPAAAALPLPEGPEGDPGPDGIPIAPFIKMGEIADEAARPAGLTADDRSKWWHRLDDDSMDFWDGTTWINLPNAVGPQGPIAPANTLTPLPVISDEKVTVPAVEIKPVNSSEQTIQLTVPAGDQGPQGDPGASGTISTSPDFDGAQGPVKRSTFAYSRVSQRFKPTPPVCGYGPWHWSSTDFPANANYTTNTVILTANIPALPFSWRPQVHGGVQLTNEGDGATIWFAYARLWNSNGVAVGIGVCPWSGFQDLVEITEHYGNPNSIGMSPNSDYAVVKAGYPSQIVVSLERQNGSGQVSYFQSGAALTVYAMPVSL